MFQIITFKPIKYNKTYVYPEWAQAFGVMLAVVSIICIPTYIIFKLWNAEGSLIEVCTHIIFILTISLIF